MEKEAGQSLQSGLLLSGGAAGIELGTEIALNCGNADLGYAKQRESTRNDPRIRKRC